MEEDDLKGAHNMLLRGLVQVLKNWTALTGLVLDEMTINRVSTESGGFYVAQIYANKENESED